MKAIYGITSDVLIDRSGLITQSNSVRRLWEVEMNEPIILNIIARAYLDEEGYLMPLERWDRNVGTLLAYGVVPGGLTEDHWKVVVYLRQYFLRFHIVPPIRKLCRDTGFSLTRIYKLFPSGISKGACRIAGIPSRVFAHPLTCLYP